MKSLTNYINESNNEMTKDEYVYEFVDKWQKAFDDFTKITEVTDNVSAMILSPRKFLKYEGNNIKEIAEDDYDNIVKELYSEPDLSLSSVWVSVSVNDNADDKMYQNFFKYGNEQFDLDPNKKYDGQIIRDESGYMFMLHYGEDLVKTAQKIAVIDIKM